MNGAPAKASTGTVGPELGGDGLDGVGHVVHVAGLEGAQAVEVAAGPQRLGRHRSGPGRDVDAEADGVRRHDDVAVHDGGVDAVAAHRLQRDLGRQVGLLDGVEDRALAPHRPVLGQAAPGLAHEPDRGPALPPAAGGGQEWRLGDGVPAGHGPLDATGGPFLPSRRRPTGDRPSVTGAATISRPPFRHLPGRMTQQHPELAAEQAYVDLAYECLERTRKSAWRLRDLNEADLGGTFQARFERNAFDEALLKRLDRPRPRRRRPRVRPHRPLRREPADHRELPHRPVGRRRRSVRTGGRRLAGAGGRAVLPGHRSRADGPRAAPTLRRRGAHGARSSRTSCSGAGTSASATTTGWSRKVMRSVTRARGRRRGRRRRARSARLLDAAGGPRAGPHRHVGRHRRHDPGRAGRDHPLPAGRRADRPGRAGHGQDRRRPPPRRLPAVHVPVPPRGPGRARDRAQPGLPALHRAGPAVARRGRRRAGRPGRPRPGRAVGPAGRRRRQPAGRPRQGRRPDVRPHRQGGPRPGASPAAANCGCRSAPATSGSRPRTRRASSGPPAVATAATTAGGASSRPRSSRPWRRRGAASRRSPRATLRAALRTLPEVREALERMWPVLTPAELLHDLFGSEALLRVAGSATLRRRRAGCAAPAPLGRRQRGPLDAGGRRPARRRPRGRSARGSGGAASPTTPTRSAPTATSWWTRSRTSRRCSSRWPPGGR